MDDQYGYYPPQQPPQQPQGNNFLFDSNNPASTELLLKIVSGVDILDDVANTLKGNRFNASNESWEKDENSFPLINELGVQRILVLLRAYGINRNTIMSTFEEQFIENIMEEINMDMNGLLVSNFREFGIQPELIPQISLGICMMVNAALRRAKNGATLDFFTSTTSHSYNYTPNQQEKKAGILDSLFRRSK